MKVSLESMISQGERVRSHSFTVFFGMYKDVSNRTACLISSIYSSPPPPHQGSSFFAEGILRTVFFGMYKDVSNRTACLISSIYSSPPPPCSILLPVNGRFVAVQPCSYQTSFDRSHLIERRKASHNKCIPTWTCSFLF